VPDALGSQVAHRLPDTGRASRLTRVNGDTPPSVAPAPEVFDEQLAWHTGFISRQIERDEIAAMR
jgi:hypothetical protein